MFVVAVVALLCADHAYAAWSDGHDGSDRPGGAIISAVHPVYGAFSS